MVLSMLWTPRMISIILLTVILISSISIVIPIFNSTTNIKVGVYYYPWYKQGWGNYHWNSSTEYPKWNVVDTPILGYYSCQNASVIRQQLEWMEDIGIDFIILSWWGNGSSPFGGSSYEDESCKFIFSMIKQFEYPIKATLMVESFNETTRVYNFQAIYDYIYDAYVTLYDNVYMKLDNLPLLCFYNNDSMTGTKAQREAMYSDSRFRARIVGHKDYVDWWFAIPCSVNNSTIPPLSRRDGMICVEPRYDNYYINGSSRFDPNYTEGLYDKQWNEAIRLAREGKVNSVTIYSWNEYHERSQVEPHISIDGRYILSPFCKTKCYINRIKSLEPLSLPPLIYIAVGIALGVILAWTYSTYKRRKPEK